MTRTTNPNDPLPDISAVKMFLSFSIGMLVGAGFVFSFIRAELELAFPSIGSIGTVEVTLLVAVLLTLVTFLGVFVLYQVFALFDR